MTDDRSPESGKRQPDEPAHVAPWRRLRSHHDRRDLHNAEVDRDLAVGGLCGNIHLATGRRCRLPAHHGGGCEFR